MKTRLIALLLAVVMLPWQLLTAQAADTSRTILVKGSNGTPYAGALVKAFWGTDDSESSSAVLTSGADGTVQFTFNDAATYGFIIVQPTLEDTAHAIGRIDQFIDFSSSTYQYTLKRADARISVLNSNDEAAPIGTYFNMWKSSYTLLRTGAFGINGDDVLYYPSKSFASIGPSVGVTNQYPINRFYSRTKTDTGWAFKFFTDSALSQEIQPVSGVHVFKFRAANVQFNLKNSAGAIVRSTDSEDVYFSAERVRTDNEPYDYFYDSLEARVGSNGIWTGAFTKPGEYRLSVVAPGSLTIASGPIGTLWVNSEGKLSLTQSGTYTDTINSDLVVPTINFAFDLRDNEGVSTGLSFKAGVEQKVNGQYVSGTGYVSGIESQNGKGAFSLPVGEYRIRFYVYSDPRPETTYFINVGASSVVVTGSTNTVVTATAGVFVLRTTPALIKFLVEENGAPISGSSIRAVKRASDVYIDLYSDVNGKAFFNTVDGTYDVTVDPKGIENPPRAPGRYEMTVAAGLVSSLKNSETGVAVNAADGFYKLSLSTPNVTVQVKHQGTNPAAGSSFYGQVILIDSTFNFTYQSQLQFNSSFTAGTKLSPGNYRFMISENSTPGSLYSVSDQCAVPASGAISCAIDFPAPNFTFSVKDQNNQLLTGNYYASLSTIFDNGNRLSGSNGNPNPESGKILGRLLDGNYQLDLNPFDPSSGLGGSKSYRVTLASGVVTRVFDISANVDVVATNGEYLLNLQKTNFKGQVKFGNANVTNTFINAFKTSKGDYEQKWSLTNNQGIFEIYLSDGEHNISVRPNEQLGSTASETNFIVKVLNSNIVQVEKKNGAIITPASGLYTLALDSTNVSGRMQIVDVANSSSYYGNINAYKLSGDGSYFEWANVNAQIEEDGDYGLKLELGSYVFVATLYNPYRKFISGLCEITSTTSNTCNINLPTTNLRFNVVNPSGSNINRQVAINLTRIFDDPKKSISIGFSNPASESDTYQSNLLDGNYSLTIYPNQDLSGQYVENRYTLTVAGGVITEVKNRRQQAVTASNGIFSLGLSNPTISGTVVAPDGTTPYPNGNVELQTSNRGFGYGTDPSGRFAAFLDEDGIYDVSASPNMADTQFFGSAIQTVTVTNGQGSNQIVLQLRRPNVSGTVRGPTGITSSANWIYARKKNADGYFEQIPRGARYTNPQGLFTFYLEPGIYKFEAQGDIAAKGSRTLSAECVVVINVDKVCDLTLSAANLKIKITDSSGAALDGANGYFYVAQADIRPTKDWEWVNADLTGNSSVYLENATWALQLYPPWNNSAVAQSNYTISMVNGAVSSILDSSGTAVTVGADGVYTLVLPSVNLIGEVKFNSTRVSHWNHVVVKRKEGESFFEIQSRGSGDGRFGFKVGPGIYQIEARPQFGNNSDRTTSRSSICVVATSGTTTCDVNLQAPNLLGRVTTSSGSVFNDVSIYLFSETAKGDVWEYGIELNQGNFGAYLDDGVYRVSVHPYWQYRSTYSVQDYQVTVTTVNGNKVITVVNKLTNATITPVSGRYPFLLGTPAIKGTVLMPGTSTEGVPNVLILPIDSQGRERWEYQTQSDSTGKFGLTVPDGTWTLWARTWGNGRTFTNSTKVTGFQVTSGALVPAGEITLRMRAPNIFGTVVKPGGGTAVPLSEIDVNIYMNGEYYYARTDENGQFGAFIEGALPTSCTDACSIYLSTWKSTEYTSKRYTFAALGDLGNLAMGTVSTVVTVLMPTGATTTPNKWGYVAVEEFDGTNYIWQPGMHTNELGKVGLSLTETKKYRLTAYPNWEREGEFSPKSVVIENFTAAANPTISITFDTPNFTFTNKDRLGNVNAWGWYEIYKLNTVATPNVYEFVRHGRLDQQGRGAQLLDNGTYQLLFWPSSKVIGITQTETVVVAGGAVTGSSNRVITLSSGNVSGTIMRAGKPVSGATVAAIADTDASLIISTVTLADGSYELSLDMSRAWTIKALDPITTAVGQTSLALVAGGNSATIVTVSSITLAVT